MNKTSWQDSLGEAWEALLDTLYMVGVSFVLTVIIGLGTVLGAMLERSGGADALTTRLLNLFGPKGAPLAMGLTGRESV